MCVHKPKIHPFIHSRYIDRLIPLPPGTGDRAVNKIAANVEALEAHIPVGKIINKSASYVIFARYMLNGEN